MTKDNVSTPRVLFDGQANSNFKAKDQITDLTVDEVNVLLKIANRVGKDVSGDILRFFVKSIDNIVVHINP